MVKGAEDDPHLPTGRLTAILIVDSYHHFFTNYQAILTKTHEALEPGGRFVIADYNLAEH